MNSATAKNPPVRLEAAVGLALTLWVVCLHLIFLTHAGALWRDEAEAIGFASMPTLSDTFHSLHYGNFPPLFATVARYWTLAGFGTDFGYRVLGCLVGLGTLGALWFAARAFGLRAPLLALALYAANPINVRIGDSMRSYGLGIVTLVLTLALIWKYIQSPKRSCWFAATTAAILTVQSMYQNACFVMAFCVAAWVVTLAQKQWKTALGVGLIGAVAAVSLLPDLGNLLSGHEWFDVTQDTVTFSDILDALLETTRSSGPWMALAWSALFAMAVAAAAVMGWPMRNWSMVYGGVSLVMATALFVAFLNFASLSPRIWHFPIYLAPSALAIEVVLAGIPLAAVQWARPALAALAVILGISFCREGVKMRQTNIDLIALKLKASTQPGDLVVISPWYFGLSLRRYLDEGKWTSVPPIADFRFHRYDLLREKMVSANPIGGLEDQIRQTLRGGHALWVAGIFRGPKPGTAPQVYPLYRGGIKMADAKYADSWICQIVEMIRTNGCDVNEVRVPVPDGTPVNPVEDISLRVIRGWSGP